MKKHIILLLLALIPLLSCQKELPKQNKQFKIGVIIPLTGALAEYGTAVRNSFELARKDNPENFKNLKFIYEDSEYQGAKSVASFQKLVKIEKVDLIYNWGTAPNEAVIPLAEQAKIPNLVCTVDTKIVAGKNYSIRTMPSSKSFAKLINDYLELKKIDRIGILKNELTFFNAIVEELPPAKIKLVESIPLDSSDFRSMITKLQEKDLQALAVFLISGQISLFYNQAQSLNYQIATIGTDFFDSQNEINQSSDLINGAIFPTLSVSDAFYKNYVTEFKNDFQIGYGGVAYDQANLLARLFNNNVTADNQEIMKQLRNFQPFEGVTGQITYLNSPEYGEEIICPAFLKIIRNKKAELFEKVIKN